MNVLFLFLNKIKIFASASILKSVSVCCLVLQCKGNLYGEQKCKKVICSSSQEHLGYLYIQTEVMFVSAADQ